MRGDHINDPVNISSDGSGDSSSDEALDTSSDEPAYTSSDEAVDTSSDERAYSSSDDGVDTSSDEGMCYRMKKKKLQKTCKDVCDCPREYSFGYDPNSEAEWMYSKKFMMSKCARKRLSRYVRSVKPAIRHHVCEMNKTFTKAGQRMYFSTLFTETHLMKFLSSPVDRMRIKLSSGRCLTYVRLMKGVDKRAAITHNWSRFVERAKLKEREICVFSLRHCKGVPVFTVHKI
ncbi:hypothetical protein ACQJBY_005705 [Aegilops geniculata]